jgi:hypothetical protein
MDAKAERVCSPERRNEEHTSEEPIMASGNIIYQNWNNSSSEILSQM